MTVLIPLAGYFGFVVLIAFFVSWRLKVTMPELPQVRDPDTRIRELIIKAAHHREQLEAVNEEFRERHNCERGSYAADELQCVIYDGEDYDKTIDRITRC